MKQGTEIFFSYAHEDELLRDELIKHLSEWQRQGLLSIWHDRNISVGTEWQHQINEHLNTAQIILLLISPDFIASEYCNSIEVKRAMRRHVSGDACVIPIILRPVSWEDAPFGKLQALPKGAKPITSWGNRDQAFLDVARGIQSAVKDFSLIQEIDVERKNAPSQQTYHRMRMLDIVWKFYIEDQLMQWLHGMDSITLKLQDRSSDVREPDEGLAPWNLPAGTTIVEAYDRAYGEMLILGPPGAGKTILLLELTRELLKRAREDNQLPIPIVLNLRSWKKIYPSLNTWLVEKLDKTYNIPRKIGQAWVKDNQILPLLDGLDQVAKDARAACVHQINDYCTSRRKSKNSSIVICCRREEYEELLASKVRLKLLRAVDIRPLTREQINASVDQLEEQAKEIGQYLDDNPELYTLVSEPIMLDAFTQSYNELMGQKPEELERNLFDAYIDACIKKKSTASNWKKDKVKKVKPYLTFLAENMEKHQNDAFFMQNLRPDWIPGRLRNFYYICAVAMFGVATGVPAGLAFGLRFDVILGSYLGTILGLVFGLVFGLSIGKGNEINRKKMFREWTKRIREKGGVGWRYGRRIREFSGIFFVLIGAIANTLVSTLFFLFGLIGKLFIWLKAHMNFVELTWEAEKALFSLRVGLVIGLICGLLVSLGVGLTGGLILDQAVGPLVVAATSLSVAFVGGLIGALLGGFSRRDFPANLSFSPNEDIGRSGNRGLLSGLLVALSALVIVIGTGQIGQLGGGLLFEVIFGVIFALTFALIAALVFGLDAFVQHYIVLFLLTQKGYIPRTFTAFLDEMVKWSLLRRNDKGYSFRHPQLLRHFATSKTADKKTT